MSFEAVVQRDYVHDVVTVYLFQRVGDDLRRGYRTVGGGAIPTAWEDDDLGKGSPLPITARFSGPQWDAIMQAAAR